MSKIKLQRFELIALLEDSKKLTDFLQHYGVVHIENIDKNYGADMSFQNLSSVTDTFQRKRDIALKAKDFIEINCNLKKSFAKSFNDFTELEMHEYKQLCDDADSIYQKCMLVCEAEENISTLNDKIAAKENQLEKYRLWENLDIPMCSSRTSSTVIFIGSFRFEHTSEDILAELEKQLSEDIPVDCEIISSSNLQTCAFIICHKNDEKEVHAALSRLGFIKPENPAKKLVKSALNDIEKEISYLKQNLEETKAGLTDYVPFYDEIRFLCDYYSILLDKYDAVSKAATTKNTIYFEGYIPERYADELKFEVEKNFTAQFELFDVDFDKYDVPVLIENRSIPQSVESITDMYAHPSNNDIDPNSIMSIFYYLLFGLMLADGGYGLLMIAFALVAKLKFKVSGSKKTFVNFALYCGISTTVWGALFGGWFGDLIPVICTTFLGFEKPPELAIWFNPQEESVKMMLFSFLFGIIHVFTGLAIRFYMLLKSKNFIGAIFDVLPVYAFVSGFAIIGKDFIEPVSEKVMSIGVKLLIIGAVLIVLTSGRSSKNILGKLGGGIYGLYNTTTGYLGDILSYARLLALNLVTTVIAMVVNQLAAMPGNIIIFILIFLVGHSINFSINLIGTYVHTNRLQYVEFFSKFYEGGGRTFTPLKINAKYFKFKEDTINVRNNE